MITKEDFIMQAEAELINAGFVPLKTQAEVDDHFQNHSGITLLVVNSMCGCAGSGARIGAIEALHAADNKAHHLVTVFPGVDEEATEALQKYMQPYPISSPSIAIIKDGEVIHCLERHQIKGYPVEDIIEEICKGIELAFTL
jgi:putative YphP/YqiW family bacilliredoxin